MKTVYMYIYFGFLSNHLRQLPLVLVFGIATAVTTVHRLLPSGVSSLMCIEKFQSPPSSEYLTRVLEKVRETQMHLEDDKDSTGDF